MLDDKIQHSVGWDRQNLSNDFLPCGTLHACSISENPKSDSWFMKKNTSDISENAKNLERIRLPSGKLT